MIIYVVCTLLLITCLKLFSLCEMINKSVGGDILLIIDFYFVSTKVQHPKRQRFPFLLIMFTPTRKWLNTGVDSRKCLPKDVLRDHLSTTDK